MTALIHTVARFFARPKRPDMVRCGRCGTSNDPEVRSSCRTCGAGL